MRDLCRGCRTKIYWEQPLPWQGNKKNMAKLKVFVVYDSKVEAYMQPFFCRTIGEAMRNWEAVCNDGKSMMSTHPADFTLFEIAEYDEDKGRFNQFDALKSLGSAIEAKKQPSESIPMNFASKLK